jgi:hypothetical protein
MADRLGVSMSFTPATSAAPQLPVLRLRLAMWAPTRDEEQAVSMLREGPDSASTYDSRPAATLMAEPAMQHNRHEER